MNEERQNERDSQLSAMFDGELSAAECELLARRLTRDDALRAQWSRYSMIGAALRAERGVKLHDRVAVRVQAQINQEISYGESAAGDSALVARPAVAASAPRGALTDGWMRFARPVFGAGIAAGVAATSILWLRNQDSTELMAAAPVQETITESVQPASTTLALNQPAAPAPERVISNGEPERYTTPVPSSSSNIAPPARLANYVVAHSEYSSPLTRRMALLGLVASDGTGAPEAADEAAPAAQRPNPRSNDGAQNDAQ
jgi:sigma-E factor negative regulatory protein RseA